MIVIKEVLPNPAGKDATGEWIGIFNNGEASVNLSGWSLKDASGKKFIFGNETILPSQELKFPYSQTRINLNNDGDNVTLYNTSGQLIDRLSYSGPAGEDEIITAAAFSSPATSSLSETTTSLKQLEFTGGKLMHYETNPLFIGLALALFFGIGVALFTKTVIKGEDK